MSDKPIVRVVGWQYHEKLFGRNRVLSARETYDHPRLRDGYGMAVSSEIVGRRGDLIETHHTLYELGSWSGEGLDKDSVLALLEEAGA